MKSAKTLSRHVCHSPIFRRAAILLAALALCGLTSCGKDDQTSANGSPPGNAGASQDVNVELENAAMTGDLDKLKAMFKTEPRLTAHRGGGGGTLLHMAADGSQKEVAEFLIAGGADVNARNGSGQTPLHRAVAEGHEDVAEFLRQHGGTE